jgi:hypothetical protein
MKNMTSFGESAIQVTWLVTEGFYVAVGLDSGSQAELAVSIQEVDLPNLLQVQANRILGEFDRQHGVFKDLQGILGGNLRPFFHPLGKNLLVRLFFKLFYIGDNQLSLFEGGKHFFHDIRLLILIL